MKKRSNKSRKEAQKRNFVTRFQQEEQDLNAFYASSSSQQCIDCGSEMIQMSEIYYDRQVVTDWHCRNCGKDYEVSQDMREVLQTNRESSTQ
jgi:uncharacterized protein with PIN domain